MLDGLVSGIFSYLSASEQAATSKEIAQLQIDTINEAKTTLYDELDPTSVQNQATAADVTRAKNRLALQSQLDPDLTSTRYQASSNILNNISDTYGQAESLADQLYSEVYAPNATTEAIKQKLLDSALDELDAGASIPSDVQAELIKAGLERAGTVGAGASSRGLAGQATRKLIGQEGLALQKSRRSQAITMTDAADTLSNRRYTLLASVFPELKNLQTQTLSNNISALNASNNLLSDAGLSGTNLTNVLMARVGASNSLTAQTGNVYSNLSSALGSSTASMYGGLSSSASSIFNSLANWNSSSSSSKNNNSVDTSDAALVSALGDYAE